MAEVPEKEASVSPSPRRKRRWWIIPVCAAAAALLAVLALLWSRYVLVAGQLCPRDAAALDLRQEELSVSAYTALARKLPDCEIRWSVPLGGAHYDSASESLAVPAVYAGEEANFAFFPRLKSLDLRQADLTAESFAAIRAAVPACAVRWSIPIGGKTYDSAAKSITVSDFIRQERLETARAALERDGIPISQAAYLAGYSNPSSFTTAFKKAYGVTPKHRRA